MQVSINQSCCSQGQSAVPCWMMDCRFVKNPRAAFVSAIAASPVIHLPWRLMRLLALFNQPPLAVNVSDVFPYPTCTHGGAVVEALRYKPEGRGIDSRLCHWNF
jgi:hypothetical protein